MESVELTKVKAKSGAYILSVNGNPIQDFVDPVKFCYNYIKQNKTTNPTKYVVLFGHDFGYTAEAILKLHPDIDKLFIYEPTDDIFAMCVPERDDLFRNEKVYISSNLNVFITQFEAAYVLDANCGIAVYAAPNWTTYFKEAFTEFAETLQRRINILLNSMRQEVQSLLKEEAENVLRNLPKHTQNPDINGLHNLCFKKPVVVCSCGESLKEHITNFKGMEERIIFICTEESFGEVIEAGIKPHFVISADRNKKVLTKFKPNDIKETSLVSPIAAYPKLQKLPFLKTFTFAPLRSVYKDWIFNTLQEQFSFDAGVSLDCTAFSLGIILGGSPVVLLGFDSEEGSTKNWMEASYITLKKELKHQSDLWNLSNLHLEGYEVKTVEDVIAYSEEIAKHALKLRIETAKPLPWQGMMLADAILKIANNIENKCTKELADIPMYNSFMVKGKEKEFIAILKEISKELDTYLVANEK